MLLDDLDRQILRHIGNRISLGSISDVLRPFRDQRAYSSLWERIRSMESQGLLVLSKQRHYVYVTITEKGLKVGGSK